MNLPRLALLTSAALALTACGGTAPPQASDQPTVAVIQGRVATPDGVGAVSVPGLGAVGAPVAADGTFTLVLPDEGSLAGQARTVSGVLSALNCTGAVSSSEAAARGFVIAFLDARSGAQGGAGTRQVGAVEGVKTGLLSRSVRARAWLYADRPTRLRGSVDCAGLLNIPQVNRLPVTVSVNAGRGWNVVDLNVGASANLLGQVSASGSVVNSTAGTGPTVWRTQAELQAQIGF